MLRRQLGVYNFQTLDLFYKCSLGGSPNGSLHYYLFRRDLGYKLSPLDVKALLILFPKYKSKLQLKLISMCLEAQPKCSIKSYLPLFLKGRSNIPSLLAVNQKKLDRNQRFIARIHSSQEKWRKTFKTYIHDAINKHQFLIGGNGAITEISKLKSLQSNYLQVCFNDYLNSPNKDVFIKKKVSIWVVSPDYKGPYPKDPDWVVVSGPEVNFHLIDWNFLLPLMKKNIPILTIPLPVWRSLIQKLGSPPTAGILFLKWIQLITQKNQRPYIFSLGIGVNAKRPMLTNFLFSFFKFNRHNFLKESKLIISFRKIGFRVIL